MTTFLIPCFLLQVWKAAILDLWKARLLYNKTVKPLKKKGRYLSISRLLRVILTYSKAIVQLLVIVTASVFNL